MGSLALPIVVLVSGEPETNDPLLDRMCTVATVC